MADSGHAIPSKTGMLDFMTGIPSSVLPYAGRLLGEGVTVGRCALSPNPGLRLGSAQVTVAMHDGAPFEKELGLRTEIGIRDPVINDMMAL